ncbi:hypothetical protein PVAP13_1KG161137 [Panicum virgatum]|uniref:Uncharacterized protein n=1 Tax=Panicum virgatum TaxID=38727 RepID=A0A8T0XJY8_PANVG|nr:hypothetical protein PVAP13_1KG161137 [Panicum virgatum]
MPHRFFSLPSRRTGFLPRPPPTTPHPLWCPKQFSSPQLAIRFPTPLRRSSCRSPACDSFPDAAPPIRGLAPPTASCLPAPAFPTLPLPSPSTRRAAPRPCRHRCPRRRSRVTPGNKLPPSPRPIRRLTSRPWRPRACILSAVFHLPILISPRFGDRFMALKIGGARLFLRDCRFLSFSFAVDLTG